MKARHHAKKHARGGTVYEGAGSEVIKEAEEKKRGGAVEMGKAHGKKPKMRMDKRARGGRTGSDKSPFASESSKAPFSSAAR